MSEKSPQTATFTVPVEQNPTLHFLKELPAWVVLLFVFVLVVGVYELHHDVFIQRLLDGVLGALLTALVTSRYRSVANTPKGDPKHDDDGDADAGK